MEKKLQAKDIIQYDTKIGNISAEQDDEFLLECFVDSPSLSKALDLNSSSKILAGRTGSGKTAILKYIENYKNSSRIEPAEMALHYISNSDILRFLNDIGADLDILFQTIWKHVLCIEYIRKNYNIGNSSESLSWFKRIVSDFTADETKTRAINYLRVWENKFWISIDENVREIVLKYEERIDAELGIDISKLKSKAGYGKNLSKEQKSEYIARARKIIDSEQLGELSKVLELLKHVESNKRFQEPCYILIDDLDGRWVDESIKYRLINSLVESLKAFGKIKNLKILVALRTDVIERAIQENPSSGFQREKFKDYIIQIEWNEEQLKKLINNRINFLYRRKYTKQNVFFEDIFTSSIKSEKPFKYIYERTLLRPRDIIAFVNHCLEQAVNKANIDSGDIIKAEQNYSIERKEALLDEWRSVYPTLEKLLEIFSGKQASLSFSEISTLETLQEYALPIGADPKYAADPLYDIAKNLFPDKGEPSLAEALAFGRKVFFLLYRVGAIGFKNSDSPFEYYFRNGRLITESEITDKSKFRLVKMLHRSLGTIVKSK